MKRDKILFAKVSAYEHQLARAAADAAGLNISELLRVLIRQASGTLPVVTRDKPLISPTEPSR